MDTLLFSWGFWAVITASALAGVRKIIILKIQGHAY